MNTLNAVSFEEALNLLQKMGLPGSKADLVVLGYGCTLHKYDPTESNGFSGYGLNINVKFDRSIVAHPDGDTCPE